MDSKDDMHDANDSADDEFYSGGEARLAASDDGDAYYDPALHVLAVATRNGQIKLFGRDNTQALLQSPTPIPSKFLRFVEGQGVLLNVNTRNQIEVWDIDAKRLCHVHPFEKEVTAISVLHKSFYIYLGDNFGNVSLLMLDLAQRCLADMPY